ncbi:hypothetical protein JCM3774_003650 [Rhodotorula dairenensis]
MATRQPPSLDSLPDELLLRVFALKPSWSDPTHARSDMLAEEEMETAASLHRIARVSRRFCRLVDSFGWVVIDGVSAPHSLRERPAKRLAVQVYHKAQLRDSACSEPWLKNHVTAATVISTYPFQGDWPVEPFPVPELYGFALRELNLFGGETSCIEGSWLEPFLNEMPSLETLRLTHVERPVIGSKRKLSLTTLQVACYYSGDVLFVQNLVSGTHRLRHLHLTDTPPYLHDRIDAVEVDDEWRTNLGRVLGSVMPELHTLTYLSPELYADDANLRALTHLLPGAVALERLVTGWYSFCESMLKLLAGLPQLRYLRMFRSPSTPANDVPEYLWTFEGLAEQVAALLSHPDRDPFRPLRIDVDVPGTLRKYDCAQRTARAAFERAMPVGVEVWLLYYPDRPYKAYPL